MKDFIETVVAVVIALVFTFFVYTSINNDLQLEGQSPVTARFFASSTVEVGPDTIQTLFSGRSFCASRVITTTDAEIRYAYSGSPSAANGHTQLTGSTTVVYLASETGCGDVTAYAVASTSVHITEFIW